nr:MAG TPA: Protein of unknown function (DUF3139) [Caudoviricetes sp.]
MKKKIVIGVVCCTLVLISAFTVYKFNNKEEVRESLKITSEDSGSVSAHKARSKRLIEQKNTKVYGID